MNNTTQNHITEQEPPRARAFRMKEAALRAERLLVTGIKGAHRDIEACLMNAGHKEGELRAILKRYDDLFNQYIVAHQDYVRCHGTYCLLLKGSPAANL